MSRSSGAGYPIWFRCHKARSTLVNMSAADEDRLHRIVRTGCTRKAPSPGHGNPRKLDRSHEYRCSCGHVGWSCHTGVLQCPLETEED